MECHMAADGLFPYIPYSKYVNRVCWTVGFCLYESEESSPVIQINMLRDVYNCDLITQVYEWLLTNTQWSLDQHPAIQQLHTAGVKHDTHGLTNGGRREVTTEDNTDLYITASI